MTHAELMQRMSTAEFERWRQFYAYETRKFEEQAKQ